MKRAILTAALLAMTATPAPPYAAVEGGDAFELLTAACDPASVGEGDADSLEEAVRVGRSMLAR